METKAISIKQLVDRLRRNKKLTDLPLETIIDYTVDFFRIVGLPTTLEEKTAIIKIEKYKGLLPADFLEMNQVRTTGHYPVYYRYTTDTFHLSDNHSNAVPFTYKLQGNYIFTSDKELEIEISYQAIEVDSCGLPLIPDNAKFLRALENYIKVQHFTNLAENGELDWRVLEHAEREYYFAVGACENEFHMLTLDKAESVANLAKSLLPRDMEHQRGYATSGNKEFIRRH